MPLTVYLTNLAGEVTAMEAEPGWTEVELLAELSRLHPETYPSGRTRLLRPPGPLEEEEVVRVWVEVGPYVERWKEDGTLRVRYVVSSPHGVIHIHRMILFHTWPRFYAKRASAESAGEPYTTLYEAVQNVWPDVTPADMREIYSVIVVDLEKEAIRKGLIYKIEYFQEEPVECVCGEILVRSGFPAHERFHLAGHREVVRRPLAGEKEVLKN